jgi:hypothetical protein
MGLLTILESNYSKARGYIMESLSEASPTSFLISHWLTSLVGVICLVGSYAHSLSLLNIY